jgi:hypothetical protein
MLVAVSERTETAAIQLTLFCRIAVSVSLGRD